MRVFFLLPIIVVVMLAVTIRPAWSEERELFLDGAILQLVAAVRSLTTETKEQHNAMRATTQALLNCEMCRSPAPAPRPTRPPAPPSPCDANPPPCYPGVSCVEDEDIGVRCGACPSGYTGNGWNCARTTTCADRPCFQSVHCQDSHHGFQCGPCPNGYAGDGIRCVRRPSRCENERDPCDSNPSQSQSQSQSQSRSSTSGRRRFDINN